MEEKFFAIGISEHRLWGLILLPMIISKKEEYNFFSIDQIIFPNEKDRVFQELSATGKEIVRIIDQYSDPSLFKLFSREKSVKIFQAKVSPEKIRKFIRPYIEKRMARIFDLLKDTKIRIFEREKSRKNIFEEDFLKIVSQPAEPFFRFFKTEQGSRYSMQLKLDGKNIGLKIFSTEVYCNLPAVIKVNRKILFVRDIEAQKIKPFFKREFIEIPATAETKYFKSFLLNLVKNYEVESEGFDIIHIQPPKKASISLEEGIDNNAVMVLRYSYGKKNFPANSPQKIFVDFHQEKGRFYYEKFQREVEFEESVKDILQSLGLITFDEVNFEIKSNRKFSFSEQRNDLVEWLNNHRKDLDEANIGFFQKTGESSYFSGMCNLIYSEALQNDWFDIKIRLEIGEHRIPFTYFRKHILDNNREYILPDGQVFILPKGWFARFRELFEFGKIEGGSVKLHKQHFVLIERFKSANEPISYEQLEKLNSREGFIPVGLPGGITVTLRPYQLEGFTWIYYLQQNQLGGCLADDMGLGKTLQAITLLQKNKEESRPQSEIEEKRGQLSLFDEERGGGLTSLVVVPASLVFNWENEIKRFAPGMKVFVFTGGQRPNALGNIRDHDIVISTYSRVRIDIDLLLSVDFHTIILDESQVIKNPSSKIYQTVNMLNSRHRIVLTGTPVENSLIDLWAQMNFINPGLLGNLSYFKKEYFIPIEKQSNEMKSAKLRKMINPFILRRTKEEVARDLPEISEQIIYCTMSEEQRRIYEEEKSGIRTSILANIDKQGMVQSSIIVLQGLTRLRQIANHPLLVDENYRDESGKFAEILRNIENIVSEGHKVLVFSFFTKYLELFESEMARRSIAFTKLTGASKNRKDIVETFQKDERYKVFLISLKAGGLGLNLTAADYVFILDPWWNPASELQAVNRAHRIGQDKNVFVYRFISENSIEEKIHRLQERKSKLAEAFVQANNPMKGLTREELDGLLA